MSQRKEVNPKEDKVFRCKLSPDLNSPQSTSLIFVWFEFKVQLKIYSGVFESFEDTAA